MKRYYVVLFIILLIKPIFAQGEAAVPFLEFQQSPLLLGAGWTGAAIPVKDASGFYYNPAQLGYFSRENNFSVFFMPQKTSWMPYFNIPSNFSSYSAAAGYNFKTSDDGLPLSIGIGYMHSKFDFGTRMITLPGNPPRFNSYSTYDSFNCFSVGASYDYYLQFNLGFSIKSFTSNIGQNYEATGTAYDLGAMITAPISKLLFDDSKFELGSNSFFKPKFDFTLGYSLTNLGRKISYIDPAQSDPIPRTARLGYTFDFGLELTSGLIKNLNVLEYSFTAEAEDILINRDDYGNSSYKNIFGDISIGDNLIALEGNSNVVVHRGHIFRLFDTIIIISGRRDGKSFDENGRESNGFGISTEGLFKLFNSTVDDPTIKYISSHFALEYYNTNVFSSSPLETNLKGVILNYKGLKF